MPKKRSISQLIRDEVEQQELFNLNAYSKTLTDWELDSCSGAEIRPRLEQSPKVVLDKSTTTTCPEQKPDCPEQKHWVETYSPSKRKGYYYYRYVYRQQGTLYHCHLKGGNSISASAIALKEKVIDAIALGRTPQEIVRLIKAGQHG